MPFMFSTMFNLGSQVAGPGDPPVDPPIEPGSSVAAQRWRFIATKTQTTQASNAMRFAELVFLEASGSAVSTSGATITESNSTGPSTNGPKLFDSDAATKWETNRGATTEEEWVECDFGTATTISGCELRACAASGDVNGTPVTWSLQFWNNVEWVNHISVADFIGWYTDGSGSRMRFSKTGRVWRLKVTETKQGDFLGLGSIEFRSVAGVAETHGTGRNDPRAHATRHFGAPTTSNESAGFAFDGNGGTRWGCNMAEVGNEASIFYAFSTFKDLEQLYLRSRDFNPGHAPRDFTVAFSDDGGGTFTTVLTVTGDPDWTDGEARTYSITMP